MHRDVVLELPEGFENIGSNDCTPFQGLYQQKRVFSLQAHPEFQADVMKPVLKLRYGQGIFDEQVYSSGIKRAGLDHDGVAVAVAIWRFLLDVQ